MELIGGLSIAVCTEAQELKDITFVNRTETPPFLLYYIKYYTCKFLINY